MEEDEEKEQKEIVLRVKDISKIYQAKNGEIEALTNINFDIKQGEFISIIGPSGCGKSTLLSIISGLESKTKGEIECKRKNWLHATKRQFVRMENNI